MKELRWMVEDIIRRMSNILTASVEQLGDLADSPTDDEEDGGERATSTLSTIMDEDRRREATKTTSPRAQTTP